MRALLLAGVVAFGLAEAAQATPVVTVPMVGTTVYTSKAAFAAALGGVTTIGFNGIIQAPDTYVSTFSLTKGKLTFTNRDPAVAIDVTKNNYYGAGATYPGDFLIDAANSGTNNTLDIQIAGGIGAIGIDFGAGSSGAQSRVIISNGTQVVDTSTAPLGSTEFLGFVSSDPITSLSLTLIDASYVLENVSLAAPAAVPEPASLALLSMGVAGIVAARRRRLR